MSKRQVNRQACVCISIKPQKVVFQKTAHIFNVSDSFLNQCRLVYIRQAREETFDLKYLFSFINYFESYDNFFNLDL